MELLLEEAPHLGPGKVTKYYERPVDTDDKRGKGKFRMALVPLIDERNQLPPKREVLDMLIRRDFAFTTSHLAEGVIMSAKWRDKCGWAANMSRDKDNKELFEVSSV